ncbi:protein phosphatase 1 regulatory subunit 35 [Nelusetta ayraudi]|uniref:protein phosphatase 1 regulatory subunit 35 n=1 Tax=Nelusetta ayraudi TaxID=303726 RepID=UPI003F72353D
MSYNPLLPPTGHRRNSRRLHAQGHTHPMETSAAAANQNPGSLASVELNSTLALKAQLQCLQREYFNKENAVLESLRRSERTKNLINTKASEVVNVARSQLLYNSLTETPPIRG